MANPRIGIPNLFVLETLSSTKVADLLQKSLSSDSSDSSSSSTPRRLNVYIQVNTSAEDSKSGLDPKDVLALAKHVKEQCDRLNLLGLMTIGSWDASHADGNGDGQNPDFEVLKRTRREIAPELGLQEEDLELSMGMSADFAQAVRQGSSSVRVGTRIFGERPKRT